MKYLIILLVLISSNVFSQQKNNKQIASNNIDKYFNTNLTEKERQYYYSKIHDYSVSLRENPTPQAYVNRGVSYAKLGLYPDAISDYNRALRIDSLYSYALFNRGVARARFRYTKRSCMDIKKSYELGLKQAKQVYDNNCGLYKSDLGELNPYSH